MEQTKQEQEVVSPDCRGISEYDVRGKYVLSRSQFVLICFVIKAKEITCTSILQREIVQAQEGAIREYHNSLVKALGSKDIGCSANLKARAVAAVKATKIRLRTDFERMLSVADPKNGEFFILEVCTDSFVCAFI